LDHAALSRRLSGAGIRHRVVFWVPLAILQNGGSNLQSLLSSPLGIVLQTFGATAPVISAIVVAYLPKSRSSWRCAQ
jgi:hypothetical protein